MKRIILSIILLSIGFVSSGSYAMECKVDKPAGQLTPADLTILYECIRPTLVKAYGKKNHEVGAVYANWKGASKYPAAPGVHSGQYLTTFVNDIGYDQYIEYKTDGTPMPVGTVIAKESFSIKKKGKVKLGPLLIMTKTDGSPDTGGWVYSGVKPNGKKLSVSKSFCHGCHQAWSGQDFLGYPIEDARIHQ